MSLSSKKLTKATLLAILNGEEGESGVELDGLDDVTLTNPANGQVLKFNGTLWVNADNTPAFADITGKPTDLAGYGITDAAKLVAAPVAANSTGVAGTWAWDAGFIYVCVATNTWKRVAIATW